MPLICNNPQLPPWPGRTRSCPPCAPWHCLLCHRCPCEVWPHHTLGRALCQQPLFSDVVPLSMNLQDSWGPAEGQRVGCWYSPCRREPLKACELGSGMLGAVERVQCRLAGETQGKDQDLTARPCLISGVPRKLFL